MFLRLVVIINACYCPRDKCKSFLRRNRFAFQKRSYTKLMKSRNIQSFTNDSKADVCKRTLFSSLSPTSSGDLWHFTFSFQLNFLLTFNERTGPHFPFLKWGLQPSARFSLTTLRRRIASDDFEIFPFSLFVDIKVLSNRSYRTSIQLSSDCICTW